MLRDHPYVRAEGDAIFEDFERLKAISSAYSDLLQFIAQASAADKIAADPDVHRLQQEIQTALIQGHHSPEGSKNKIKLHSQATEMHIALTARIRQLAGVDDIPDYLIEGIKLWIDTFMSGRLTIRLAPFPASRFEIVAHLKPHCFFDSDFGHLRWTYGSRPNVPLTMLGMITSTPTDIDDAASELAVAINPGTEVDSTSDSPDEQHSDAQVFEEAFRALFPAMEEMERLSRFDRYPNITVYPLAVYRSIRQAVVADDPPRPRKGLMPWLRGWRA